jgi:PAS domain S-box-containing protein
MDDQLPCQGRRAGTAGLEAAIESLPVAMVLTDPALEDNPIVYVNEAFEKVTHYSRAYAVGRNCRFLQGEESDPATVRRLREAIAAGREISVELKNYRADGSAFMNRLLIAPITDPEGNLAAFLGVQTDLTRLADPDQLGDRAEDATSETDTMLRELQHRVKNHLSMIVSMIRMQASREITKDSFTALSERVQSLALLYEELSPAGAARRDSETVPTGAYLTRIASTLGALEGQASIRLNVEADEIDLPVEKAARLGLLLTEFLTNALKHAFVDRAQGMVQVRFERLSAGGLRLTVEDDGVGLPEGSAWPDDAPTVERQRDRTRASGGALDTTGKEGRSGLGGSIVKALVGSLDADLSVVSSEHGTVVILDVGDG